METSARLAGKAYLSRQSFLNDALFKAFLVYSDALPLSQKHF